MKACGCMSAYASVFHSKIDDKGNKEGYEWSENRNGKRAKPSQVSPRHGQEGGSLSAALKQRRKM